MADQKISALTEITTPAAGDMLAIVNAAATKKVQLQNVAKFAPCIGARVYSNASISLTNNTDTVLTFNTERYDSDVCHDNVTNNSRLTCKTAGVYSISATAEWATNGTGYRRISIRLNGTTVIARQDGNAVTPNHSLSVTTDYALAVNDYLEVMCLQTSGGALNVVGNTGYSPEFMFHRIGA